MDSAISGYVDEAGGVPMRLGTRLIVFSSIFLLLLPWFAYKFIDKVESSLLQAQEEAQSMAASAIALVLSGYQGLFDIDEHALYVYPMKQSIHVDGYDEDWEELENRSIRFFADTSASSVIDPETDSTLLIANQGAYLYALSLIHISEPTRPPVASRMPSSA